MTVSDDILAKFVSVIEAVTPLDRKQSRAFREVTRGTLEDEPKNTSFDRKFTVEFEELTPNIFFGDPTIRDWGDEVVVRIGYVGQSESRRALIARARNDIKSIVYKLGLASNRVASQDLLRMDTAPALEEGDDGNYLIAEIRWRTRYQEAY